MTLITGLTGHENITIYNVATCSRHYHWILWLFCYISVNEKFLLLCVTKTVLDSYYDDKVHWLPCQIKWSGELIWLCMLNAYILVIVYIIKKLIGSCPAL